MCIRDRHSSVERGDALRILTEKSKMKSAKVTEIQRQKNRADYKQAVKMITEGKHEACLLYTSDAADERSSVDLGGRRIIKKKKEKK